MLRHRSPAPSPQNPSKSPQPTPNSADETKSETIQTENLWQINTELKLTNSVIPSDLFVSLTSLKTLNLSKLRAEIRELGFYDRVNEHLSVSQTGVILDGVESGGPAGLAHLDRSDIIIRLGKTDIDNVETLRKA